MPTMRLTSLACLLVFAMAAPALAQLAPPAPPAPTAIASADATEKPEYKQAVEQALEEYRLGHFEEARSLFERAYDIDANARTLRGLGMVEFELRHYVRATELLEQSLASTKKPLTDDQRKSVEQLLARTRQFVANYAVKVEPSRKDIAVELDGKPIELSNEGKLSIEAGEHTLRISGGPELTSRELKLDVKGGEEQTLRIELQVRQPEPPQQAVYTPPPEPTHPYRKTGIALTAVGAAALVAGGVLGGLALSDASSAETQNDPDADSAKSMALGSDIAIGIGIAAAAAGIVLWVWKGPAAEKAAAKVDVGPSRLRVRF
jgi:hypothetical protein